MSAEKRDFHDKAGTPCRTGVPKCRTNSADAAAEVPDEDTNTNRDLICPSCHSRAWYLAHVSGDYGDPRVVELYRCRNPQCDGAFRVSLWKGRRSEVASLWSKLTDSSD